MREELFTDKVVFWSGSIDYESLEKIIKEIHSFDEARDFVLVIASPGGDIDAALAFYDYAKSLIHENVVIRTVALGEVSSAALVVFMAGKERYVADLAYSSFHPITRRYYQDVGFEATHLDEQKRLVDFKTSVFKKIILEKSTMSADELEQLMKDRDMLDAIAMLEKGIATHKA